MELKLKRPIAFFDLETTGTNIAKDRIVEISVLKIFPNGNKEAKTWRVNPEMPIPKASSDIHGILDEDVANEPTFKELSKEVYTMIKDADLGGYNSNRFDIPLIAEEFLRADIDFDMKNRSAVDVQTIFFKREPRNLSAAYRFYCDKELIGAHGAEADTLATYEILKSQLDKYEDLPNDITALETYSRHNNKTVDFAGMIIYDKNGVECFNFGKYKGQKVEDIFAKDPGYYGWIQNADFPLYTKKVLTAIKLKGFNK